MLAEQSLRDGNLQEALSQLQIEVKANPAKVEFRVFLFQLLSLLGSWGRALTQLRVSGELDPATLAMVQTYSEALRCEALRVEVFAGTRSPMILGDPEEWVALCLNALSLGAQGNIRQAGLLRTQAYKSAPLTSGAVDGVPFDWIADADSRIGPFLEAIVNRNYYWIPFNRIKCIRMEAPEDLRDLVWTPAQFTWVNNGQAVGLIPTRYPGSEKSQDFQIQMARKTVWEDKGDGEYFGLGQRIFATDSNDYSLLNIREIVFNNADEKSADQPA